MPYIKIQDDKIIDGSRTEREGFTEITREQLGEYEQGDKSIRITDGVVEIYDTPKTEEETLAEQKSEMLSAYNAKRAEREELKSRLAECDDIDESDFKTSLVSEMETSLETIKAEVNGMLSLALETFGDEVVKSMLLNN